MLEALRDLSYSFGWRSVAVLSVPTVVYVCYKCIDDDTIVWVQTAVLHITSRRLNTRTRSDFQQQFALSERKAPDGHSHPRAASERTAATCAINDWCMQNGFSVFAVSGSPRDYGKVGYHQFYMAKDVTTEPVARHPTELDVIKMVDVDYYVDLYKWVRYGRPIVIYTFVPTTVSGKVTDGCFTIRGNIIEYYMSGGATYKHQLWDYNSDWLVFDYWWGSIVCSIEQRHVGEDHRVILLTPETVCYGPFGWFLPGQRPRRMDFRYTGNVNRVDTIRDNGDRFVSVGLAGSFVSIQMRYGLFEAIRIRFERCKKAEMHAIERFLNKHPEEFPNADETAAHLFEIMEQLPRGLTSAARLVAAGGPVTYRKINYQCVGPRSAGYLVTEDGKDLGRAVAPSLVDNPAVVPCESFNNDLACIIGRVERPYNSVTPPENFVQYALEFCELLVPIPGIGSPWSIEQVLAVQEKPAQRGRNERVIDWLTDNTFVSVSAFMKSESYGSVNDPRNISQVPTEHTLRLSSYTYPFKEQILKNQPWYGPGLAPTDIANRLTTICQSFDAVSEIDYSRWDGTVSVWMRAYFERAVYLRWAAPKYRSELGDMLEAEVNAKGRTRQGLPYRPAGSRLSGSPLTTDSNCIMNAMVSYCAARHAGVARRDAWRLLGLFVGDDGVTGISPDRMEVAARLLGVSLKCAPRHRGDAVHFLGRVFLDPWTTNTSVQDPVRTLKKLHISFAPPDVPDNVALYNRALGYKSLDPNAPIVSAWCDNIIQKYKNISLSKWASVLERDTPYYALQASRDCTATWPQPAPGDPLAYQRVAEELGVASDKVYEWHEQIKLAPDLTSIAELIHVESDIKIAAFTDSGDLFEVAGDAREHAPMPKPLDVRARYRSAASRIDRIGLDRPLSTDSGVESESRRYHNPRRAGRWKRRE